MLDFIQELRQSPIALHTAAANTQHYEVPTDFFKKVLGPRLKYSSCYYPVGDESLEQAEKNMLHLTCERAGIDNGQQILELGCGWGSLTLWMAEHFPKSKITAVSNSAVQRKYIESQCSARGLENVKVLTSDMNDFAFQHEMIGHYDRVVSVEMFEHMRNYKMLFQKISSWLRPDGRLFFHIFSHDNYAYPFAVAGDDDWMARNFFTGGIMPSDDLVLYFQDDLVVEKHWRINGRHYGRTSEQWLQRLDAHREEALDALKEGAPTELNGEPFNPDRQVQRWRIFFMACAELFNFDQGRQWGVSHYMFKPR
jgi:cyclopropane-fatty-acyl-phospholipid synthase